MLGHVLQRKDHVLERKACAPDRKGIVTRSKHDRSPRVLEHKYIRDVFL